MREELQTCPRQVYQCLRVLLNEIKHLVGCFELVLDIVDIEETVDGTSESTLKAGYLIAKAAEEYGNSLTVDLLHDCGFGLKNLQNG